MLIHFGVDANKPKAARCLDQGSLDGTLEIVNATYYPRQKWAYNTAGSLQFLARNKNASATVADTDWIITKFAYDASTRMIDSQTLIMAYASITASSAWDI